MDRENRLLTLALIIFLLAGATLVYSQTPPGPNTIQEGEGLNLPTITATNGYFYGAVNVTGALFGNFGTNPITTLGAITGTQINTGPGFTEVYPMDQAVTAASGVTFATVDTGQGANELYDMDQDVETTSDVNFTSVEADVLYISSTNVTQALWDNLGATAYLGFDANRAYQENYFLVDGSNDRSPVQAALNYINAQGGGTLYQELGVVQIEDDLYVPSSELYIIQGQGLCNVLTSSLTSGGSVWSFIDEPRFTTNVTGNDLVVKDMTFDFQGVYNNSAFDFMGFGNWVSSYGCAYAFRGTVPDGNAGNPGSTLSGNCLNIGSISGPSNLHFTWVDNRFYDNRQGSATASCLLCFKTEEMTFERLFIVGFQNTLVSPNLMFCSPVSGASISYNTIFTEDAWDAAGSQYANQIMASGSDKNLQINFNQFLLPTDVSDSHLYINSGVMNVEGTYPINAEGGTDPMDRSVGGGGTVNINFKGRGYEVEGSATILNGNTNVNVTHGLVGTPTFGTLTGTTTDTDLLYFGNLNSTVAQIVASDGAVGGDRTIYYKLIYSKSG